MDFLTKHNMIFHTELKKNKQTERHLTNTVILNVQARFQNRNKFTHMIHKFLADHLKTTCLTVVVPRRGGGTKPQNRQKLSKKNGMKLVGYTFRLKNYVNPPSPILSDFAELAPPLLPKIEKNTYSTLDFYDYSNSNHMSNF